MEEQDPPRPPTLEEWEILGAVMDMLKKVDEAKERELQEGFKEVAGKYGITIKDLKRMFMEVGFGRGRDCVVDSMLDIICAQRVLELLHEAWPKKFPGAPF